MQSTPLPVRFRFLFLIYWLSVITLIAAVPTWLWADANDNSVWKIRSQTVTLTCAIAAVLSFIILVRKIETRKRLVFGHVLGIVLAVISFYGVKWVMSLYAPPWPYRELRPCYMTDVEPGKRGAVTLVNWEARQFNSWGMRDLERSLEKADGTKRIAFIGDSFLEGLYCSFPLNLLCEKELAKQGQQVECINLGTLGTGPIHYYYRLKNVGLSCNPDAVYVFFYSGNDFLDAGKHYDERKNSIFAKLVAEAPKPSILGQVLPEVNWLLVNRLQLSEIAGGNKPIPNENTILADALKLPAEDGYKVLAKHMHKYYYPNKSLNSIHEIVSRGGTTFWDAFRPKEKDQEKLFGWILNGMINWESMTGDYAKSVQDVAPNQYNKDSVAASVSWLHECYKLCRDRGVQFKVVLAPTGVVDPDLVRFWQPWPRAFSWYYQCHAKHQMLAAQLTRWQIPFIDLATALNQVPGVYRVSDQHWNERGHDIVANRMVDEILGR